MEVPSMTESEILGFVKDQKVMRLATVTPDGKPHLVAIWFTVIDGDVYFSTGLNSKKAENIRSHNYISAIMDEGKEFGSIKGVVYEGPTETVTDPGLIATFGELSASKYWGSPDDPGLKKMREVPMERVLFKIIPQKVRSWDYSKIGGW